MISTGILETMDNFMIERMGGVPAHDALTAQVRRHRLADQEGLPDMRDYQIDLIMRVDMALNEKRAVCMQAPTGTGKSVMLSELARGWPGRVYWLTHRRELITQSSGHLQQAGRHDAIVTSPIKYWNRVESGRVQADRRRPTHRRRSAPRRRNDVAESDCQLPRPCAGRDRYALALVEKRRA